MRRLPSSGRGAPAPAGRPRWRAPTWGRGFWRTLKRNGPGPGGQVALGRAFLQEPEPGVGRVRRRQGGRQQDLGQTRQADPGGGRASDHLTWREEDHQDPRVGRAAGLLASGATPLRRPDPAAPSRTGSDASTRLPPQGEWSPDQAGAPPGGPSGPLVGVPSNSLPPARGLANFASTPSFERSREEPSARHSRASTPLSSVGAVPTSGLTWKTSSRGGPSSGWSSNAARAIAASPLP